MNEDVKVRLKTIHGVPVNIVGSDTDRIKRITDAVLKNGYQVAPNTLSVSILENIFREEEFTSIESPESPHSLTKVVHC